MGNKARSGLPRGVKDRAAESKSRLDTLRADYTKSGYTLQLSDYKLRKYYNGVREYLSELNQYQTALGENSDMIREAGGSVDIVPMGPHILGDSGANGDIRMNSKFVGSQQLVDTLPHEHTHNLVDALITKELGHPRGTPEFNQARQDAIMYQSINTEALKAWKADQLAQTKVALREAEKKFPIGQDEFGPIKNQAIIDLERKRDTISNITTPYEAAKFTGMRDYAIRDYWYAPKGAGVEIPTVAAENFVKARYNWDTLKLNSSYSYYVLQELKKRIKKK